jgi:hypothetical protein
MVGLATPPPTRDRWRMGVYWIYFGILSVGAVFWLSIVSPIIRPTLPTNPQHLLFCIFAGIAIADAAAHAVDDIAGIWKPHDLGGAQTPRQRFSARKLLMSDVNNLLSHLTAAPVIAAMAYAYTLLPPRLEDQLFGASAGQGLVFWNFLSQSVMGGLDVFAFFLSQDAKTALQTKLALVELQPKSFEAGAILAGLKLYGLLIFVSTLRVIGAPVVLWRTWLAAKRAKRKRKAA